MNTYNPSVSMYITTLLRSSDKATATYEFAFSLLDSFWVVEVLSMNTHNSSVSTNKATLLKFLDKTTASYKKHSKLAFGLLDSS